MHKPHMVIALLLFGCTVRTPSPPTITPAAQELVKLKAKLMSADYRADIDELSKLRDEVARLRTDSDLGYLAHYWSGFASWRMAINGANRQMKTEEQKTHLLRAATEFYAATRLEDDFADGYASAAAVNSWLPVFEMGSNPDMVVLQERMFLARALLSHAT